MSPPPPDPRTDAELIKAINAGDADAFEVLYYRYRDWVVRLAQRFTGHADDALDVLQETFAYLARKAPHLSLSARMTTFLYPVVKHLALAARRKRLRAAPGAAMPELPADPPNPDPSRAELAAVLAGLPEPQREVVLMRFVDGMALAEIAEALRIPIGTSKSRLHKALASLRDDPRTRGYFER